MIENVPATAGDTCPYPGNNNNNNNNEAMYSCSIVEDVDRLAGGPTRTATWKEKILGGGGIRGKGDPKEQARRKEEKRQREEEKKARKREKAKKKKAPGAGVVNIGQTGEQTSEWTPRVCAFAHV